MGKEYKYRKKKVYNGVTIDVKADTAEALGEKFARKVFEIDHALSTTGSSTIVNKWVEYYFDTYIAESVGDGTLADRKAMYNKHLKPYIGAMKIRDVSASDCQAAVNRLKGYSKESDR